MRVLRISTTFVLLTLCTRATEVVRAEAKQPPALVLWVTVDQLRGDMPLRYLPNPSGGFRHLREHGAYYANAQYQHATTFTAVGHASLFTGGHAAQHGILGNDWYDVQSRQNVDSVHDARYPLVGQDTSSGKGFSPANLTSSTVGDELVLASAGRSRVFSVSGKDRAAILPAGHLGKAFWYSKETGSFVSSVYYYKAYPDWVARWNAGKPAEAYRSQVWTLKDEQSSYIHRSDDDRPCEKGYRHLRRTFPHALATDKTSDFLAALTFTPFADELILQFTEELIRQEKLGAGESTDLLAVSFSATDQIGHAWGPESLEAEDNVRRIDALLGRLLEYIDQTVGLDKVLIVLAADHGMDEIPECTAAKGFDAGRHYPEKLTRTVNDALKSRFKVDRDLVKVFWNPSLYLDLDAVSQLSLETSTVERAVAEEILKMRGFACAVTRTDLLAGRLPDDPISRRIQNSFHPTRSGNVLIIPSQSWFLYPETEGYAAVHGSPYTYDTYVPVFLAGPGIETGCVSRAVAPEDIAPTVCAYLGIKPPTGCTAQTLPEVLSRNRPATPLPVVHGSEALKRPS
jgi:predicted AlkP superfamily pyrophosphatase or phosphodiesterase